MTEITKEQFEKLYIDLELKVRNNIKEQEFNNYLNSIGISVQKSIEEMREEANFRRADFCGFCNNVINCKIIDVNDSINTCNNFKE